MDQWGAIVAMAKPDANRSGRYRRVSVAKPIADKATWEDATPDDLWKTVLAVTNAGDYIAFSKTRDGGAVVVTVKSEDGDLKEYATGEEEVRSLLALIRASAEDSE